MNRKGETRPGFAEIFGYPATHTIQAPGRVNLIGEQTDSNAGFVLPCAIDYQTVISCAPRADRTVRVIADDYDKQVDEFSLAPSNVTHDNDQWANYVSDVVQPLQERNTPLGGGARTRRD
ncbi:galactokinase family protein, partial [Salmonella enterica]|uniref:galactokinase family protein n=1 Tax=Salmonella enterica TaxID=28901 RepID=UPI00398C5E32